MGGRLSALPSGDFVLADVRDGGPAPRPGAFGRARPSEVRCHADQPSEFTAGKLSVVSDALDSYCTFDELFDQLLNQMRWPVEDHIIRFHLVSRHFISHGDDAFEVKVTKRGKRIQEGMLYWQPELWDENAHAKWVRVRHSREKRQIAIWDLDEAGNNISVATFHVHKDPLRLEVSVSMPDGTRVSNKIFAMLIQQCTVRPALECLSRNVRVRHSVDSLCGDGLSVMSDPLDGLIAHGVLFDELVGLLELGFRQLGDYTRTSDCEFSRLLTYRCRARTDICRHNRGAGKIVHEVCVDGRLHEIATVVLHRRPLVLEFWKQYPQLPGGAGGLREAGPHMRDLLVCVIDQVLAKLDVSKREDYFFDAFIERFEKMTQMYYDSV